MSPIDSFIHSKTRLEAGLLGTQEEEKTPFILPASIQDRPLLTYGLSEAEGKSKKMPISRRAGLVIMVSLLLGLGLAIAKDPLLPECMRWGHGLHELPTKMARTVLNKRQDGFQRNSTTTPVGTSTEQSGNTAKSEQPSSSSVLIASSTSLAVVTTSSITLPSSTTLSPSAPEVTPISSTSSTPSTSQVSLPSTTSTTSSAPQETVSTSSLSPTSTIPLSSESSESTSFTVTPTSSKFQKTITTGLVTTSIPIAQTMTTTLENGGTLTITSTSWVAVVPTNKASSGSEPKLQNAASKFEGHFKLVLIVGVATLSMLLV